MDIRRVFITVVCVLLMAGTCAVAQVPERILEADGYAAGSGLQAKDEATKRALRKAIELGVGTLIDSETMVKNFQLLDDRVYSDVKGYIKEYEVIFDNNGEGGMYHIRVRATVALARIDKDLRALKITMEHFENPRTMMLFAELIDGLEQAGAVTQTEFENIFLRKGFDLIDKAQMGQIKERDAAMNYADPLKAAALGRRFGAEIIIVGQATSDLVDTSRPYGVSVFAYEAQISAKAIKCDTAEIMAVDASNIVERGGGRIPSAKKALRSAAKELADKMTRQVAERMRSEAFNLVSIQIVADGATATLKGRLKTALGEIRGVQSVNERSFTQGILILDVKMEGSIWKDFDVRLENLPDLPLAVTGKSQNRIEVEFR